MKTWKVKANDVWPGYTCISGDTIKEAVSNNMLSVLCAAADNIPGKCIPELAKLEYNPGILGGKGGYVATINYKTWAGPTSNDISKPATADAWIYADKDGNPA